MAPESPDDQDFEFESALAEFLESILSRELFAEAFLALRPKIGQVKLDVKVTDPNSKVGIDPEEVFAIARSLAKGILRSRSMLPLIGK